MAYGWTTAEFVSAVKMFLGVGWLTSERAATEQEDERRLVSFTKAL
jgi:hypothetical protein